MCQGNLRDNNLQYPSGKIKLCMWASSAFHTQSMMISVSRQNPSRDLSSWQRTPPS